MMTIRKRVFVMQEVKGKKQMLTIYTASKCLEIYEFAVENLSLMATRYANEGKTDTATLSQTFTTDMSSVKTICFQNNCVHQNEIFVSSYIHMNLQH